MKKTLWSGIFMAGFILLLLVFKQNILEKEVVSLTQNKEEIQQKISSLLHKKETYEKQIWLANQLKEDGFLKEMPSAARLQTAFEEAAKNNYLTSAHLEIQPTQYIDMLRKKKYPHGRNSRSGSGYL